MKNINVIRHIAFEDLGSLGDLLQQQNANIRYFDAAYDDLSQITLKNTDLLIILGGPIGVYEANLYPFLETEIAIIREHIHANRPTLGICLGAQLIAYALGAKVYPGHIKELGWAPLILTPQAQQNFFQHLAPSKTAVLHWHGDTFDLPKEAQLQASTEHYPNQAFTVGNHVLALQFHPEVKQKALERWYVGHACEISQTAGVNVLTLRDQAAKYAKTLEHCAVDFWRGWLQQIA